MEAEAQAQTVEGSSFQTARSNTETRDCKMGEVSELKKKVEFHLHFSTTMNARRIENVD